MSDTYYDNRELSWLKFNARVLEEAEDTETPFCERLSFASIFQSNLDEFFMVRVGALYDQMLVSGEIRDNKTGMTCEEQLNAIFKRVKRLNQRKDTVYDALKENLKSLGVEICQFKQLDNQEMAYMDAYFESEVQPLLSPQIIGKKQPFPFLKNKEIYAVVVLEKKGNEKLGIVPCSSDIFNRLVPLPGQNKRFLLMEEVILHYVAMVFDRYRLRSKSLIRVIRNADIDPDEELYDDDTDFRQVMEQLVRRRKKLAPVKMEYSRLMDAAVLKELGKHLGLKSAQIYHSEAPLDLSFFARIRDLMYGQKELFYEKQVPGIPEQIDMDRSLIEQIEEKDKLLFYPFDSMEPFLRMLNEAADAPDVVSVKITLYRVASNSKVVEALIRAAENGKEVVVLVELRARFDEENNIEWSRRLEDAGCRVLYGLDKLKVHSKLCLITRWREGNVSYITQIGTGNYNEKTAKLYTDLSLMTAHEGIGAEASEVFQKLCLGETIEFTKYLMVAPKCLRNKVIAKIDQQILKAKAGQAGYVGVKINSLTDKVIIDKLKEASDAGVEVELIVRGSCCLISQITGVTENITVRSIVGRYLEHSRIYIFGQDDIYIASADFMTRNTTRRVEVAAPIFDQDIKHQILDMFHVMMSDNVKARVQLPDGQYVKQPADDNPINSQKYFTQKNVRL